MVELLFHLSIRGFHYKEKIFDNPLLTLSNNSYNKLLLFNSTQKIKFCVAIDKRKEIKMVN